MGLAGATREKRETEVTEKGETMAATASKGGRVWRNRQRGKGLVGIALLVAIAARDIAPAALPTRFWFSAAAGVLGRCLKPRKGH